MNKEKFLLWGSMENIECRGYNIFYNIVIISIILKYGFDVTNDEYENKLSEQVIFQF